MPVKPMPVRIRGHTYSSVALAADDLGVTPNAIYNALERGTLDTVGLGWRKGNRGHVKVSKPITIAGRTFPSQIALSRYLGMSDSYVKKTIGNGRFELILKHYLRKWKEEIDGTQGRSKRNGAAPKSGNAKRVVRRDSKTD